MKDAHYFYIPVYLRKKSYPGLNIQRYLERKKVHTVSRSKCKRLVTILFNIRYSI